VDDSVRAELLHRAGRAAQMNADQDTAKRRLQQAVDLFEALGDHPAAARSLAALAQSLFWEDRLDEAIELMRRAVEGLAEGSAEQAEALAALSHAVGFKNEFQEALAAADAALAIAEPLQDWATVVRAFNTIGHVRLRSGRTEESMAFRERALRLCLAYDLTEQALRTYNNLADGPLQLDRFREARDIAEPGLALAQSRGDRSWQQILNLMIAAANLGLGQWDETLDAASRVEHSRHLVQLAYLPQLARIHAARGNQQGLRDVHELANQNVDSTNVEYASGPTVAQAIALNVEGRHREALEAALPIALSGPEVANEDRREAYVEAGLAAVALDDTATIERLIARVAELPPAMRSPLLRAGAARLGGLLAQKQGDLKLADERLAAATRELREIEAPFVLGQVLLEQAELLSAAGREEEATARLAEATSIFQRLRAEPWLARARALATGVAA
jgi:tetratricopeptide (TPR) repeat protein